MALFSFRVHAAPALTPISAAALKTKLAETSGHPAIVNLWATWCGPCREEMPELIRLRKDHPGTELFLISGDAESDAKIAADFLGKLGVDFPVYRVDGPPDEFMVPFIKDWTAVLPTTILFDGSGRSSGVWIGRVKIKELTGKLEALMKPNSPRHASLASPSNMGSH